jgi:hypothetical protein
MALFFDHLPANARELFSPGRNSAVRTAADRRIGQRLPRAPMPHHVCVRLLAAWLVALCGLLALVLTIRFYV